MEIFFWVALISILSYFSGGSMVAKIYMPNQYEEIFFLLKIPYCSVILLALFVSFRVWYYLTKNFELKENYEKDI